MLSVLSVCVCVSLCVCLFVCVCVYVCVCLYLIILCMCVLSMCEGLVCMSFVGVISVFQCFV